MTGCMRALLHCAYRTPVHLWRFGKWKFQDVRGSSS